MPVVVQASDILDDLRCLRIVKRRAATHAIPREQQFKRYRRIDAVPQKMAGERRKR
jgi:hypothetical protein